MSSLIRSILVKRDPDIADMDNRLDDAFWHVAPRETYVRELQSRLIQQMRSLPSDSPLNALHAILILLAGMVSSFLIVVMSIRLVIYLITAFSLLYQYRSQLQGKRIDTIPPAM
jgi:hypothetical protein